VLTNRHNIIITIIIHSTYLNKTSCLDEDCCDVPPGSVPVSLRPSRLALDVWVLSASWHVSRTKHNVKTNVKIIRHDVKMSTSTGLASLVYHGRLTT